MRRAPLLAVGFAVASLALAIACENKQAACESDGDCPVGTICRAGVCGEPGALDPDAGVDVLVTPPTCIAPGGSCNNDIDCCTAPCSGFRCSGGTSGSSGRPPGTSGSSGTSGTSGTSGGTTSSGGTCQDLYGICASDFDCCLGLRCQSGSCR